MGNISEERPLPEIHVWVSRGLSVGPVFESHSLLVLGWWGSLPRASAIWTLDSVPMFKFLCIPVLDGSGPLLFSPSKIHPGYFPSRLSFPSPLSSLPFCLLSLHIRVFSRPLQQRLFLHHISVGSLQPSSWRSTNVLSWFPVQRPICRFAPPPPLPVWLLVLGLGVGGEAK